jgi:hypothetical protein
MRHAFTATLAVLGLVGAPALRAQDDAKTPRPTPTKQHELLKQFEGEWDTVAHFQHMEGKAEAKEMKDVPGTESANVMMGDLWLAFVYHSTVKDTPFVGHGLIGYDPAKAKFTGIWVDSFTPYIMSYEGTVDPTGKKFTFESTGTDPKSHKPYKGMMVCEIKDHDHRSTKFFRVDETGAQKMMGEILYTRTATH